MSRASAAATPIALLLLAAGTAAYAYFVDRTRVSDADRAARRDDVFPSFRPEDVRRVELSRGPETLVLEREADGGTGWTMTAPRHEGADAAAVDGLVQQLERARRARTVGATEAAGLDAPRVRGRVTVGSLEYRFTVGADAPRPEGAAYMQVDGEGTFVVDRDLKASLLEPADAYRDRVLAPYGSAELARLDVRGAAGAFALVRSGPAFRVGGADGLRAARDATDRVFAALAEARAETFLPDTTGDEATARGAVAVTLTPRDGSRPAVRWLVGASCPGRPERVVVLRTAPTRVSACVAKGLADALSATPGELVDRGPLFARADEIAELLLETTDAAGPRVDVARRGTGWHERAPEDRDLTSGAGEAVDALAGDLVASRALDVRPAADGEPLAVHVRVTVRRAGTGATEVVELGRPGTDGVVPARRLEDGALLRLPGAVARRFDPGAFAFRAPADASFDE